MHKELFVKNVLNAYILQHHFAMLDLKTYMIIIKSIMWKKLNKFREISGKIRINFTTLTVWVGFVTWQEPRSARQSKSAHWRTATHSACVPPGTPDRPADSRLPDAGGPDSATGALKRSKTAVPKDRARVAWQDTVGMEDQSVRAWWENAARMSDKTCICTLSISNLQFVYNVMLVWFLIFIVQLFHSRAVYN